MDQPLLSIRNLSVRLNRSISAPAILDNVSLDIAEGETVGLVGESGSGKSTLGMSVMRLTPKPLEQGTSGEIIYQGRDITKLKSGELEKMRGAEISMILQDPMASLNPVFSIGRQLKEALQRRPGEHDLQADAENALAEVKIPSPATRLRSYPHQMSGGMRQRIVGAIAIAQKPKLLICDEPTTSLDVTIQYQFLELLNEMHRTHNMGMLFITHDFGVVAKMCNRVAVMYAGQIVESGPVRDIFHKPAHWYTRALLDSVPGVKSHAERLPQINGSPPSVFNRPEGCAFHTRCSAATKQCLSAPQETAISKDHKVRCFHPIGRT